MGSGFLVAPDHVLTNWHVVRDALAEPARIAASFDLLHAPSPEAPRGTDHGCSEVMLWRAAPPELDPSSPFDANPLDYALLRLSSSPPGDRGYFDIKAAPATLYTGTRVIVIGHPNRQPLSVSFSQQAGLHGVKPPRAYYDADTLHGSSGSIVLVEV
ncbi:MAG: trypsin-like peptidase domain-containing protein, partial [Myxococcales bacterium]|nr:trypsin-like peptidase domain-containing protein [Myxococcales bacterium]